MQNHTLRAYDAVQLASALAIFAPFTRTALNPFVFLSADNRLLTIAQAEGLPTDNPLQHP